MRRLLDRIVERLIDWLDGHDWRLGSIDLGVEGEEDCHAFLKRILSEEKRQSSGPGPDTA